MKIRAIFSFYDFNFNWKISLWSAKWRGKPRNKILIFPGKSTFAKYWSVRGWSLHKSPLNGFFGFWYFLTNPFTDIAKHFSACAKYQKKFERNSKFSSAPFINWILFGYPSFLIMSYTPVFLQKSFQRDIAEPKNAAISYTVCIHIMCA